MNFDSISNLMGGLSDLLDQDNDQRVETTQEKAGKGFSALQPVLQNFMDNDEKTSGQKVEDLDQDSLMDVIMGLGKNIDFESIIEKIDLNQVSNIAAFITETFHGSSKEKQEEHQEGISSLLGNFQNLNLDGDMIQSVLGSFFK